VTADAARSKDFYYCVFGWEVVPATFPEIDTRRSSPVAFPPPRVPRIAFAALSPARDFAYVVGVAHLAGYQPRVAEHGVLYRVIDEHLETFLDAAAHHADGHRLPKFVEQEFRDFLTCGVLAHGFARLRCGAAPSSGSCHFPARAAASARAVGAGA
jgi:catechol 2,3-dioxygenase-like lactoylglutathione lyase family enzyme